VVSEINEYYLFHGTKADTIDNILHEGVDCRLGGDHLLFGRGAYFAETTTKADQYPGMIGFCSAFSVICARNINNRCATSHYRLCNERIEYKLLSLTYKVLTTSQPDYLHNLISVQSSGRTLSAAPHLLSP